MILYKSAALVCRLMRACLVVSIIFVMGCAGTSSIPQADRNAIGAVDCDADACIDFIYIHGAAHHSAEVHERFREQIAQLHQWMQVELNDTPEFVLGVLDSGKYQLNPEPRIDFWGDEKLLMQDLDVVNWMLSNEMRQSPSYLTGQRQRLAIDIHDLFWVGHSHHQSVLLSPLHEEVKASAAKGRPVVLLGHSAGSLIAANYMLYRVPYINLNQLDELPQISEGLRKLAAGRKQNTCLAALLAADLVELGPDGELAATLETTNAVDQVALENFREAFWALQINTLTEVTRQECITPGDVKGIVAFGTMAEILLSKAHDAEGVMLALAMRYLFSEQMFWLTVNHADDPVSFSTYDEEGLPALLEDLLQMDVPLNGGFVVSAKPVHSGATLLSAHSWYLTSPREFADLTAKTYADGYQRFVSPDVAGE